jgi:DNA-nicking Smr family endonuclease
MGRDRDRQPPPESALLHQPFRALRQIEIKRQAAPVAPQVATPATLAAPPTDAASLFRNAVAGVTPLDASARARVDVPAPASPAREVTHPDAEALAELCDLVTGNTPFDISDSDEHIEGAMVGLDPRLLRRLRGGEFAYQSHVDLHGLTIEEARKEVESFLTEAYHDGKRCVLIIHGRGRNSKDQIPVLKNQMATWLARGQRTRLILAFTSARPCDGGTGALYVLLRRQRSGRRPIRVLVGAKW